MKNITVYPTIWQTIPYSFNMTNRLESEKCKSTEDLILQNDDVLKKGISEMTLNIRGISVLDKNENEHNVTDFKQQVLNLKGMHTGLFLRSKKGLNLEAGEYSAVRFHLVNNKNSFITKERNLENINSLSFLDFKIEDGLEINENKSYEITLRFDFVPYNFMSYFKAIKDFFKKERHVFSSKLEGSLDS